MSILSNMMNFGQYKAYSWCISFENECIACLQSLTLSKTEKVMFTFLVAEEKRGKLLQTHETFGPTNEFPTFLMDNLVSINIVKIGVK